MSALSLQRADGTPCVPYGGSAWHPEGSTGLRVAHLCCQLYGDIAALTFSKSVSPRHIARENACPWQRVCSQHLSPCPEGRFDRTVTLIIRLVQVVIKIQALRSSAGENSYKPVSEERAHRCDMAHESSPPPGAMLHTAKYGMGHQEQPGFWVHLGGHLVDCLVITKHDQFSCLTPVINRYVYTLFEN